jgi:hypothetical protein
MGSIVTDSSRDRNGGTGAASKVHLKIDPQLTRNLQVSGGLTGDGNNNKDISRGATGLMQESYGSLPRDDSQRLAGSVLNADLPPSDKHGA